MSDKPIDQYIPDYCFRVADHIKTSTSSNIDRKTLARALYAYLSCLYMTAGTDFNQWRHINSIITDSIGYFACGHLTAHDNVFWLMYKKMLTLEKWAGDPIDYVFRDGGEYIRYIGCALMNDQSAWCLVTEAVKNAPDTLG